MPNNSHLKDKRLIRHLSVNVLNCFCLPESAVPVVFGAGCRSAARSPTGHGFFPFKGFARIVLPFIALGTL